MDNNGTVTNTILDSARSQWCYSLQQNSDPDAHLFFFTDSYLGTRKFCNLVLCGFSSNISSQKKTKRPGAWVGFFVWSHVARYRTVHIFRHSLGTYPTRTPQPRYQYWGSVTFWCGPGSADPYLWLMHPDPDPTSFFSDFKDAEKIIFHIFLS